MGVYYIGAIFPYSRPYEELASFWGQHSHPCNTAQLWPSNQYPHRIKHGNWNQNKRFKPVLLLPSFRFEWSASRRDNSEILHHLKDLGALKS